MTKNSSPFTAYVSSLKGSAIDVFTGDANTGTLEHIQTVELLGKCPALAQSADGGHLYASTFAETEEGEVDRIESFRIHPETKTLDRISATEIIARMAHISVDRSGGFLFGASFFANRIAVYPIGRQGHVQPFPTAERSTPLCSHQMLVDESNRYLYVPCMKSHTVLSFLFDEKTGTIAENSPPAVYLPEGTGPRHIAFHPNRRYLYLINEMAGTVTAYRMDQQTGGLTEIMSAKYVSESLKEPAWGAQIHVTPDGGRLFAAARKTHTLASFEIDQKGGQMTNRRLTDVGKNPRCHSITGNGRSLVLAALEEHKIEVYDISGPDAVKTAELPTAKAPAWVEIIG